MAVEGIGPIIGYGSGRDGGRRSPVSYRARVKCVVGTDATTTLSGERTVLLGISKRGDRYLRTLPIHGARSALYYAARRQSQS